MPEQIHNFSFSIYGGLNENDQADVLVGRSHTMTQNGYVQAAPVESPQMDNMDFDKQGIRKRKGSTEDQDITGVKVADEVFIKGIEWQNPATGARIQVVVGKKSIYTNQSGSWAQINDSASAAYTHNADVAKVSFAMADGHLFIGLDSSNKIQVYRNGADLDDELDNGNTYEEAFSAATHTITGTWSTGYYLLTTLHSRLVFSDGNTVINYTPMATTASSGVWDLGGGTAGFFQAAGRITALIPFSPQHSDSNDEYLYISSLAGLELTTGFTANDYPIRIEGSTPVFNHQSFAKVKNWIVYLSDDKTIMGVNGNRVIDFGRRFTNLDKDGSLDEIDQTTSANLVYGFYDEENQQAIICITTDTTNIGNRCLVLDFKMGEPLLNEPQESFERKVRCLVWNITTPATNDWFIHMFSLLGSNVGLTQAGKTYTLNNGDADLGTLAIEDEWYSPIFMAGDEGIKKQWLSILQRGIIAGNWTIYTDVFLDRDTSSVKTTTYTAPTVGAYGTATYGGATYTSDTTVKGSDDTDRYSEAIQWRVYNRQVDETYTLTGQTLRFMIGAEER